MKLASNKRVRKDISQFEKAINEIQNVKNKIYYTKIFEEYKAKIKTIDQNHDSNLNHAINPKQIREDVIDLQELRFQLQKLLIK